MKHIPKHAKRSKAKKYIINSITFVMFVICIFSLCALDSESWLPTIMFIPSLGWCLLYLWANY